MRIYFLTKIWKKFRENIKCSENQLRVHVA